MEGELEVHGLRCELWMLGLFWGRMEVVHVDSNVDEGLME